MYLSPVTSKLGSSLPRLARHAVSTWRPRRQSSTMVGQLIPQTHLEFVMALPRMLRVRQRFARPLVDNIPAAVRSALDKLNLGKTIKPGQTVALTGGSRGIANIPLVLKNTAQFLKDLGAKPFIVPAMG